jgi:hypothetical protein
MGGITKPELQTLPWAQTLPPSDQKTGSCYGRRPDRPRLVTAGGFSLSGAALAAGSGGRVAGRGGDWLFGATCWPK